MENDDPVVSESESEEEDDYVKLSEPSETAVNNKDGLLDKLGDISWPESAGWIHKLSVDVEQDHEVDVNDDLTRELAFHTQALEGVREAFTKLQSAEVDLPFLRPPDYSAAMFKSDMQMEEVKSSLLAEKREKEAEERKKARDNEKLAKEVQKQKQKKDDVESVKNSRKQSDFAQGADSDGDGDLNLASEDGEAFERSSEKKPGVDKKVKGRERKDSKFGFGGRKGMKKQNAAATMGDFRGHSKSTKKKQKV